MRSFTRNLEIDGGAGFDAWRREVLASRRTDAVDEPQRGLVAAVVALGLLLVAGCAARTATPDTPPDDGDHEGGQPPVASVLAAWAAGEPGAYVFSATVRSADTGCDQYADWWEVLTEDGELVYRRILRHSHVDEQPFTRTGEEAVAVGADTALLVRAHLSTTGYGGQVVRGTPSTKFVAAPDVPADLAPELAAADPRPDECLW